MKSRRGSRSARRSGSAGEAAAWARLDALFERFDRLTPDDLARIGLGRSGGRERDELRHIATSAARSSGRSGMLAEARAEAREIALRRYSAGSLHPTWLGLNWGLSQGTTGDRVAIIDALEDAAAAAVVADLVDREVTDALALDAEHVLALASGDASEGSLDRALRPPAGATGGGGTRRLAIAVLVVIVASWTFGIALALESPLAGALALGIAMLILWTVTRTRIPPRRDGQQDEAGTPPAA